MTKAGLEKEAEKSLDKRLGTYAYIRKQDCYRNYVDGYTDGAEPREKQIDELKAQIKVLEQNLEDTEICENGLKNRIAELENKLANADYQLEGRDLEIRELEAQLEREKNLNQCMSDNNEQLREQVEKMKCCENCKYNSYWGNELHCNYGLKEALQEDKLIECKNMDKWEIKEK